MASTTRPISIEHRGDAPRPLPKICARAQNSPIRTPPAPGGVRTHLPLASLLTNRARGHRLYGEDAVTALRVIKAAQRLGFTLEDVAELLEAGRHRHGRPVAVLQEQVAAKLAEVDAKIADLTTIRTALAAAVDAGCDDLTVCASSSCCPIPFTDLAE
ncbi:MerR family DNA-binding protein [Streptomyces vastus]|uniref:MerR family DNA-binding protein n=1 Tax=Streptomyces vastus TaxID=285451 RepID=UPI0031E21549